MFTPPDLTTTVDLKAWLGLKGDADDALLTQLVTSTSAAVQREIGRTFAAASYTETRNGDGRPALMLCNRPVTAVSSVMVDGAAVPARASIGASGYTFDESWVYLTGYCFHRGQQNVSVSYAAGYTVIPADLQQATIEACAFLYRERDRIGLASKGLAGETTAFLRDLPPHLMRRFQQFAPTVAP